MILNYFTVPNNMKKPTLKLTAVNYLKTYFALDTLTTTISNLLWLVPGDHARLWFLRLKLFRILRQGYIRFAYRGVIFYFTQ